MGANYIPSTPTDVGAEPELGNPSTSGYVLSSSDNGIRSWVEMNGGTGGDTYPRGTSFPESPTAGDAFYRTDRKVLYVYEGDWQPIESYGDITLYLSATGNDANTGWSAGDPVATLSRLWDKIPRFYGGHVTVNISGVIEGTLISLGGKYPVAGAYVITFVGVDGSVVKSSFTGTIDESIPANKGLISGLSGLATNAYRGKILKNTTRGWQTVILENSTSTIRSVGQFTSYLGRQVATGDSWEVRDFGAKINHRVILNSSVSFRNIETQRIDVIECSQARPRFDCCYSLVPAATALTATGSSGIQLFDCLAQTSSGIALSLNSCLSESFIVSSAFISTSTTIYPLVRVTNSSLYILDAYRISGQASAGCVGILAEKGSFVRGFTSIPGSWIKSCYIGLQATTFSAITELHTAAPDYTDTTTETLVDATTANGTIS